jgi:HEPN domain-containing protein
MMNRDDFRKLTEIRLQEAEILLQGKKYDGAYYLSGYVVECALKACIAKKTKEFDFPDKKIANGSHTHDLASLMKIGGLQDRLDEEIKQSQPFNNNWGVVKNWSEESRYSFLSANEAADLFTAVSDPNHGVLKWIKQYW